MKWGKVLRTGNDEVWGTFPILAWRSWDLFQSIKYILAHDRNFNTSIPKMLKLKFWSGQDRDTQVSMQTHRERKTDFYSFKHLISEPQDEMSIGGGGSR